MPLCITPRLLIGWVIATTLAGAAAAEEPANPVAYVLPAREDSPETLELFAGSFGRLTLGADVADPVWPALEIGDHRLIITRSGAEAVWVSITGLGQDISLPDGLLEIEAIRDHDGLGFSANGVALGSVAFNPAEIITIAGQQQGAVYVTLDGFSSEGVQPAADPSARASGKTTLSQFLFPDGDKAVRASGQWISKQALFRQALLQLRADAGAIDIARVVFLDWETGDDANSGFLSADIRGKQGAKKTWAAAKSALNPDGVLIVNGNNGIYTDDAPYAGLPAGVTIIALGDMMVGTPASVAELFASGRWRMTANGPLEVSSDKETNTPFIDHENEQP